MTSLGEYVKTAVMRVDEALERWVPAESTEPVNLHRAMRYSLFAGGKRIRPILCIAAADAIARHNGVVDAAIALELIHTYSLIHDDLPALDNDDLRRGRPTCHKVFGEAMAILAGDALLTRAFEVIATLNVGAEHQQRKIDVIAEIATAAGTVNALIGGQVVDILSEGKQISAETLDYI